MAARISNATINEALSRDLLGLATALGRRQNKQMSSAHELRCGRKGSLSIRLTGDRLGWWHDHEAGIGDRKPLRLVEHERGTDWRDARAWALSYLGWSDEAPPAASPRRAKRDSDRRRQEAEAAAERRQKADNAAAIYAATLPVAGTPAEAYLRRRGITAELPDTLRWQPRAHRGYGALVVPAVDAAGAVQAIQRIYVTDDGRKAPIPVKKRTNGALAGAAARFPGKAPLILAEGPETALSVWQATGRETWAVLGTAGFATALVERGACVTIAADDFAAGSPAEAAIHRGARELVTRGCAVTMTTLPVGGGDFNDVLQRDGAGVVDAIIAAAGRWRDPRGPQMPTGPATVPLDEGRARLDAGVETFVWDAVPGWLRDRAQAKEDGVELPAPLVWLIKITTAAGKSRIMRKYVGEYVKAQPKAAVAIFVPTHKLGAEQAAAFTAETGIVAAIWRGMEQPDPDAPGLKMCREPELARAARSAGVDMDAVCQACPMREVCGYQGQKRQTAQVWFLPHQMLFHGRPAAVPEPTFIVIDEDFHKAGLAGVDEPVRLALSTLEADPDDLPPMERQMLKAARGSLLTALEGVDVPTGLKRAPLTREAVERTALTALACREARASEWVRKPRAADLSGEVKDMIAHLKTLHGQFTPRVPLLWELMANFIESGAASSPHIDVEPQACLSNGEGFGPAVHLRYRRDVSESWRAPTLILDATAREEVVRCFFPHAEMKTEIHIEAPHQRVTWVRDSFSKARLVTETSSERHNQARRNNLERVRRFIEAKAAECRRTPVDGPDVLVIANDAVEKALRAGPLPSNVDVAHFNDVAGRNTWEHVRAVITIGRPLPNPQEVEVLAGVLTGQPVAAIGRRWPQDGRHPDPVAEAVRWTICEGQLLQSIGRGRGINRTADTPLDVLILGDVELPLQVDRMMTWQEAQPAPLELMAARGVIPACDTSTRGYWPLVAAVLPDLFPTPDAARKDFSRGQTSMSRFLIDECPRENWSATTARAPGARYSVPVLVDPELVAGLSLEIGPVSAAARPSRPAPGSLSEPAAAELDPLAGTGWSQYGARLWVRDADGLRWIGTAPPPPDWAPEPVENAEVEAARTDVAAMLHRAGSDPWRAPLDAPVPEDVPWMRISGHRIARSRRGVVAYITMPYASPLALPPLLRGLPPAVPVDLPHLETAVTSDPWKRRAGEGYQQDRLMEDCERAESGWQLMVTA